MLKNREFPLRAALLILIALPGNGLASTLFNFNYSLPAAPDLGITDTITASGTITATLNAGLGSYTVTAISGTRFFNGVATQIIGLLPAGTFGSDNLLFFPNQPYLDEGGISFTVDHPALSDDGHGTVNIFYDATDGMFFEPNAPGFYIEALASAYGTFNVSMAPPVPEPSARMLCLGGLLVFAAGIRQRLIR